MESIRRPPHRSDFTLYTRNIRFIRCVMYFVRGGRALLYGWTTILGRWFSNWGCVVFFRLLKLVVFRRAVDPENFCVFH